MLNFWLLFRRIVFYIITLIVRRYDQLGCHKDSMDADAKYLIMALVPRSDRVVKLYRVVLKQKG